MKGATLAPIDPCSESVVSIRAPREGRDPSAFVIESVGSAFQSARPVKGATGGAKAERSEKDVSIRAPREGRDRQKTTPGESTLVSIRAPREGRDPRSSRRSAS